MLKTIASMVATSAITISVLVPAYGASGEQSDPLVVRCHGPISIEDMDHALNMGIDLSTCDSSSAKKLVSKGIRHNWNSISLNDRFGYNQSSSYNFDNNDVNYVLGDGKAHRSTYRINGNAIKIGNNSPVKFDYLSEKMALGSSNNDLSVWVEQDLRLNGSLSNIKLENIEFAGKHMTMVTSNKRHNYSSVKMDFNSDHSILVDNKVHGKWRISSYSASKTNDMLTITYDGYAHDYLPIEKSNGLYLFSGIEDSGKYSLLIPQSTISSIIAPNVVSL